MSVNYLARTQDSTLRTQDSELRTRAQHLLRRKHIGKRRLDSGGGHYYRQTAQRIFQSATGQH
jgi:hypothetical protein